MNLQRNEIRTGLLVVICLTALVAVLLYLGAPGVFVPQHTFSIYFDNASGIKPGADVMLAGRKVGQVSHIYAPVPEADRPDPKLESLVEVKVSAAAKIYRNVRVQMVQVSMLGEMMVDFTSGREADGLAPEGAYFRGERQPGLQDALPQILEKLDPAFKMLEDTLGAMKTTTQNLNRLTSENGELPETLKSYRKVGENLTALTGPDGSLHRSLVNVEKLTGDGGKVDEAIENVKTLTGPESSLAKTLRNAEEFTGRLSNNKDIDATLKNFRDASAKLNRTVDDLRPQFSSIGKNLEQASDTVKHQPWRLIWPSTKKYPGEQQRNASPNSAAPRLQVSAQR